MLLTHPINRSRRRSFLAIGAALSAASLSGVAIAGQPADGPAPAPSPPETFTAQVRAGGLGEVLARLSDTLDTSLAVDSTLADQRITFRAEDIPFKEFQNAVASLYQTSWQAVRIDAEAGQRLNSSAELMQKVGSLRRSRRTRFVNELLETAADLRRRPADSVADGLRADVRRRQPLFPAASLQQIDAAFARQALFLTPIRGDISTALASTGYASAPFASLSPRARDLFARLALEQLAPLEGSRRPAGSILPAPGDVTRDGGMGPAVLSEPHARVEYRVVYGDRWTGSLLQIRAGAGDTWATLRLPSVLYSLPDYGSLYPHAGGQIWATEVREKIDLKIDPNEMTWDQALLAVARKAKISVLSDSYVRPEVFRPEGPAPILEGSSLGVLLEKMAGYYGYVGWKRGSVFVFRHRYWAEEERVAAPERRLRAIGADLSQRGKLRASTLADLATLTDEQLLSIHLHGKAAGRPTAPESAFDLNEMNLIGLGLEAVADLEQPEQEMLRDRGLPALLMGPNVQGAFLGVAMDRSVGLSVQEQDRWGLRLMESFRRERLPAGWAEIGSLRFLFDYGPSGIRRAELAIRAPALPKPEPATPSKAQPAASAPAAEPAPSSD